MRSWFDGDDMVRLSTIEGVGSEETRDLLALPSTGGGKKERSSRGDSGEKEGNEVKDLSEIDDAELDM
jgi:hypothetical protein